MGHHLLRRHQVAYGPQFAVFHRLQDDQVLNGQTGLVQAPNAATSVSRAIVGVQQMGKSSSRRIGSSQRGQIRNT